MGFKSARVKAGKTVAEVMAYLGVSDGAVYQWESGYSHPTVKKLKALAEFYGCTVDDLLKEPDDEC
jgi:transcriptional regulator with XRE-family HTH domain